MLSEKSITMAMIMAKKIKGNKVISPRRGSLIELLNTTSVEEVHHMLSKVVDNGDPNLIEDIIKQVTNKTAYIDDELIHDNTLDSFTDAMAQGFTNNYRFIMNLVIPEVASFYKYLFERSKQFLIEEEDNYGFTCKDIVITPYFLGSDYQLLKQRTMNHTVDLSMFENGTLNKEMFIGANIPRVIEDTHSGFDFSGFIAKDCFFGRNDLPSQKLLESLSFEEIEKMIYFFSKIMNEPHINTGKTANENKEIAFNVLAYIVQSVDAKFSALIQEQKDGVIISSFNSKGFDILHVRHNESDLLPTINVHMVNARNFIEHSKVPLETVVGGVMFSKIPTNTLRDDDLLEGGEGFHTRFRSVQKRLLSTSQVVQTAKYKEMITKEVLNFIVDKNSGLSIEDYHVSHIEQCINRVEENLEQNLSKITYDIAQYVICDILYEGSSAGGVLGYIGEEFVYNEETLTLDLTNIIVTMISSFVLEQLTIDNR